MDLQLVANYFTVKSTDIFTVYGWIDDLRFYVISRPFQQYFSYTRTMRG